MSLTNDRGRTRVHLPYLRSWRIHQLMSQDELAAKSGVAASTIIKLEREGSPHAANLSTVAKLATALGITRHQLVYEKPAEPGHQEQEGDTKTRVVA